MNRSRNLGDIVWIPGWGDGDGGAWGGIFLDPRHASACVRCNTPQCKRWPRVWLALDAQDPDEARRLLNEYWRWGGDSRVEVAERISECEMRTRPPGQRRRKRKAWSRAECNTEPPSVAAVRTTYGQRLRIIRQGAKSNGTSTP